MQRTDLKEKDYQDLLNRIVPIILEKGLKSTTMDTVANILGMSKRTLYEIFGSKAVMLKEAIGALERQNQEFFVKTFSEADNVMEAFIEVFKYNRDLLGRVNVEFYRDMDRLYKVHREDYDKSREDRYEKMVHMFNLGVEQGMFRPDADYSVHSRIVGLQMEALKRMEELFPEGITLQRVFDTIILGSLRSIASEKGMEVLDNLIKRPKQHRKTTTSL